MVSLSCNSLFWAAVAMLPTVRFDTRAQDDSQDFAYHRILATGAGDEEADSDVEDIEDPRAGKFFSS